MHGYVAQAPRSNNPRKITTVKNRDRLTLSVPMVVPPKSEPLPYGTHNIDPLKAASPEGQGLFAEFVMNSKGLLTRKLLQTTDDVDVKKEKSNDPAVRLAFASKLDSETRAIQERQVKNLSLICHAYDFTATVHLSVSCDVSDASLPALSISSLHYLILSYLGYCAAVL